MRAWKRCVLCSTAIVLVALPCAVFALSPPVPVQHIAPIGWETRITPGFDPPIEYQIVYSSSRYNSTFTEDQKKVVKGWGPAAFPVLKKLSEDPAWKDFKPVIESLLQDVEVPESVALFVEKARKALDTPDEDGSTGNILQVALNQLRQTAPTEFQKLFDECLASANAKSRHVLIRNFATGLNNEKEAVACAKRLREIQNASPDDAEKKMIGEMLAEYESRQRANEPMQRILDFEKGKGPQQ